MVNHFFVYNFHFSIVSTLYRLLYLQWFNSKQSAWRLTLHFLQWYTEVSLHPGKLQCCCNPLRSQWLIPSNSKLFAGLSKLPLRVFEIFKKKQGRGPIFFHKKWVVSKIGGYFKKGGVSLIFILTSPFQCYLCVCVCVCVCVFCLFTLFLSVFVFYWKNLVL